MKAWGSNHNWGDSIYKDIGPGQSATYPDTAVGIIGGNAVSFSLAILPTQGVAFSENSGENFVVPFAGCAGFSVIDSDNNERHIIVDVRTRKLYDVATKKGPNNTSQVQRWKDKQNEDGTGGTDIIPRVRFFDDLGSFENFILRNATNHFFGRCTDPINRGADDFDTEGFLAGTEWTMKIFSEGEKLVSERTASTIPLVSDTHFAGHEEAHRFAIELSANKSGHMITGRKQEYIVTDKYDGNNTSLENEIVEELSYPSVWYSRRPIGKLPSGNGSLIDRISGSILSERNAGSTTTDNPPLNLGGYSIYCNDKIFLSGSKQFLMFMGKHVSSVYADNVELSPVVQGVYDGWKIYSISDIPNSEEITICPASVPGGFCNAYDIRQFSSNLSADEIAFYVDNIINHNGDTVLP